jgi:hypothetical protein
MPIPVDSAASPGRTCPLRYRYGAAAIATLPEQSASTLYVIGGLYGNLPALDAIEDMVRAEPGPVTLCFNGDFNWFNVDDAGFRAVNERVLHHGFIAGNVEAELGAHGGDTGCGCAYPDTVDDAVVERSNLIHARLQATAARHPDILARLEKSALAARWRIGDLRIGVVHGDADSLAGWRFDAARLDDPAERDWQAAAFAAAEVDLFASSHTCLPALRRFKHRGPRLIANNGAAGMPNFRGERCGLLTRIGVHASPHEPIDGQRMHGIHVDALAICYDHAAWLASFLANWPEGSPAWLSYFRRIVDGPDYARSDAFAPG